MKKKLLSKFFKFSKRNKKLTQEIEQIKEQAADYIKELDKQLLDKVENEQPEQQKKVSSPDITSPVRAASPVRVASSPVRVASPVVSRKYNVDKLFSPVESFRRPSISSVYSNQNPSPLPKENLEKQLPALPLEAMNLNSVFDETDTSDTDSISDNESMKVNVTVHPETEDELSFKKLEFFNQLLSYDPKTKISEEDKDNDDNNSFILSYMD